MFLDIKLQDKIKFWAKSKRKFKIRRYERERTDLNLIIFHQISAKIYEISMRYPTLPQEGAFMEALRHGVHKTTSQWSRRTEKEDDKMKQDDEKQQ